MLDNFKEFTFELTEDEELRIVPLVIRGLKTKIGKQNAIKNKQMLAGLKGIGIDISEARLRKVIQFIRLQGLLERLIATSSGYWISNDLQELEDYQNTNAQRLMQYQIGFEQMNYQIKKFKDETQNT